MSPKDVSAGSCASLEIRNGFLKDMGSTEKLPARETFFKKSRRVKKWFAISTETPHSGNFASPPPAPLEVSIPMRMVYSSSNLFPLCDSKYVLKQALTILTKIIIWLLFHCAVFTGNWRTAAFIIGVYPLALSS